MGTGGVPTCGVDGVLWLGYVGQTLSVIAHRVTRRCAGTVCWGSVCARVVLARCLVSLTACTCVCVCACVGCPHRPS